MGYLSCPGNLPWGRPVSLLVLQEQSVYPFQLILCITGGDIKHVWLRVCTCQNVYRGQCCWRESRKDGSRLAFRMLPSSGSLQVVVHSGCCLMALCFLFLCCVVSVPIKQEDHEKHSHSYWLKSSELSLLVSIPENATDWEICSRAGQYKHRFYIK